MRTVLVEDFNVTFVKSGLGLVSLNDDHDVLCIIYDEKYIFFRLWTTLTWMGYHKC